LTSSSRRHHDDLLGDRRENEPSIKGGAVQSHEWWVGWTSARFPLIGGGGRGAGQPARYTFRRLWVAQMSFHSLSAAARPRREIVRIPRLCLTWANTGSMVAARFL